MREFLLRRLVQVVPTVLGLLVLIFVVSRVIPGDPVRLALGPEATRDQIAAYQPFRRNMRHLRRALPSVRDEC